MKFLEIFVIVIMLAVGMFGFAFMSGNSTTLNVTDTFGKTSIPSRIVEVNTTDPNNSTAPITFENVIMANNSYQLVQNVTAVETQGSGAGIIIVAACAVLILIFAFVVMASGAYSKGKYRT
jgi:hypothetical protein